MNLLTAENRPMYHKNLLAAFGSAQITSINRAVYMAIVG